MTTLLIILHILVSLFLIAIVLLQHGKGADIGATFGGSSQSLFGSEGPVPLLNKITTFSAIVFMGTSISLAYLSAHKGTGSVMSDRPVQQTTAPVKQEIPVTIPLPGETVEPQTTAPVQQQEQVVEPVAVAEQANEATQTTTAEQVEIPVEEPVQDKTE